MSLNLGNWADKLTCEICQGDWPPDKPPTNESLPEDFWETPPEAPDESLFDIEIPDIYPTISFKDGGIQIGIGGKW